MSLLEVQNLTIRYGGITAVSDLSFSVDEGETVVLTGPNGSGKSSVLLAIMGVVKPAGGTIRFRGEDIRRLKPWDRVARGICILPENRRLFEDMTVEENLRLALESFGNWGAASELQTTCLQPLRERMKLPCRLLSGGERQLVAIARLKLQGPTLALLDDPLAGIGLDLWAQVWEMAQGAVGTLLAAPREDLPFDVNRIVRVQDGQQQ